MSQYSKDAAAYFGSDCRRCGREVSVPLPRAEVGGNHDGIRARCRDCGASNWCEHVIEEVSGG